MNGVLCRNIEVKVSILAMLAVLTLSAACERRDVEPAQPKEPPLAAVPFDAENAKMHQQTWADHLGVSVESTNSIGMKLALIPAGNFLMGTPHDAKYHQENEYQHHVRITKPFYLGVYEVTQEEYESMTGSNPSTFSATGRRKEKVCRARYEPISG